MRYITGSFSGLLGDEVISEGHGRQVKELKRELHNLGDRKRLRIKRLMSFSEGPSEGANDKYVPVAKFYNFVIFFN